MNPTRHDPLHTKIAYFSMEIVLEDFIPTYAGGLGVLAGDTVRSAADMEVPMVAVSLIHRHGYFDQRLDRNGWQTESPCLWSPEQHLLATDIRCSVRLEGNDVQFCAWRYDVTGRGGFVIPIYLLDSNLPENDDSARSLTNHLYGGTPKYRLMQEALLGVGGVRILRSLGYEGIRRYHMNEGHAALLTLELLRERLRRRKRTDINEGDVSAVRKRCVFTTHTPVPAGHDQFPINLARGVLGELLEHGIEQVVRRDDSLNLTYLALVLSRYINGVAKKHGEVSRHLFADYRIDSITNGVHAATWTCRPFQRLFDKYISGWRDDSFDIRYALGIPREEILAAHREAKESLFQIVLDKTNVRLDLDAFTLGFARRATPYKRPTLLFHDVRRLREIARRWGAIQVIFAGKAHPKDHMGKELIRQVHYYRDSIAPDVKVSILPNYDVRLAKSIVSGVDVWLNTPQPPLEASGTSGMKAALNGVPSLSVLDGWWIEGCIEGITGWSIEDAAAGPEPDTDADSLYAKLDDVILPAYHQNKSGFAEIMAHAIALNGSFFNTQRMLQQYVLKAYFR